MARWQTPIVIEQRMFGGLCRTSLAAPELATAVRAGQYVLLRCAPPVSYDPLLRRALFVAAADRSGGTVSLLYVPDERGLTWLAAQPAGAQLDLFGPLGTPFALDQSASNLLLLGAGPALAALLLLAGEAVERGMNVTLVAGATAAEWLPPPFLLPPAVEYAGGVVAAADLPPLPASQPGSPPPLTWADQLAAALPEAALPALVGLVQRERLRWQRGFAQVALAGPLPCGMGACQACLVTTRHGLRTRCKDGPVFELRELRS